MLQEKLALGCFIFSLLFLLGVIIKTILVFTTNPKNLTEEDVNFKKKWTKYKRGK